MRKWASLSEALSLITERLGDRERAKTEILQALRRCEIKASAEQVVDHWIHRRTQLRERGLYVVVPHQTEHMASLHPNWWTMCDVDWVASTAHGRWCDTDRQKVSEPYRVHVTGVLLLRLALDQIWPPKHEKAQVISAAHRPVGSGFVGADAPFVDQMHEVRMAESLSPTAAAKRVVGDGSQIAGGGTIGSKIDRLTRRYNKRYTN